MLNSYSTIVCYNWPYNFRLRIIIFYFFRTVTLQPSDVYAFVGSIYMSKGGGRLIPVIIIHVHYGYSKNSQVDDLAILKVGILKYIQILFYKLRIILSLTANTSQGC